MFVKTPPLKGKSPGGVSDDLIGQNGWTEQHENIDLLQQIVILCPTLGQRPQMARQQAQEEIKQMAKKDLDEKSAEEKWKHGVHRGEHWSGSGRIWHLCKLPLGSVTPSPPRKGGI